MHRTRLRLAGLLLTMLLIAALPIIAADRAEKDESRAKLPAGVSNSQNPADVPPTPLEALAKFTAPDGFRVTLFAGEPDVAQPIAMTFDDRGRLWVAECYSYDKWSAEKDPAKYTDRIIILEDTNADGEFDQRRVFRDKLRNLSGIELGFGGVWALCAPDMLFIPDANRDDVPDAEPVVKLDGWSIGGRHNIVNGLTWGPDGWLYGCQGILAESAVGKPGTPEAERMKMNCGVWRYHPTRETIEAVAHGTTNPWGLDFNEHGEAFFINCVIGHLWHLIPGAHYERMFGRDFNPHAYGLIGACSDHLHWGGGAWTDSRGGKGIHSEAGGGHAHSGLLIYQGDNWPDEYRGDVLMNNIHGTRVNRDKLVRHGSGYVAQHGTDMLFANSEWFRGVALKTGPDGGVYIADWTDLGECHDNDGVHRASGRIFKAVYKQPKPLGKFDLALLGDLELVGMQLHRNDWFARHARRLLQERAAAGKDLSAAKAELQSMLETEADVAHQLRAVWTLHAIDALGFDALAKLLEHPSDHVRAWSVRLLVEVPEQPIAIREQLETMAREDKSGLVRLYLASAMQRMNGPLRWKIATGLASHAGDADDANLPLMIWYGIEPAVPESKPQALALLRDSKLPLLRQNLAKRIAAATP